MLSSYYALRRSEVLGVRWSNIDFKNKVIKIAHKVVEQKIGGKISVVGYDRMKTESSNRVLPLIPEVEDALLRLREHQNEQRRHAAPAFCTILQKAALRAAGASGTRREIRTLRNLCLKQ